MNKSTSIILMLLIAFVSFNISAQDIIGTWEGKSTRTKESPNNPITGEIKFFQTFNADKTGVLKFDGLANGKIDQNTKLNIKLRGSIPFTWAKENSTITMKINSSQLNIELTENDLEFICNDPNMAALMNAYKPQMVQMMQNQLKTSLGTSFSETSVWTNVKINGDTMYITDGGVDYKLTRIK